MDALSEIMIPFVVSNVLALLLVWVCFRRWNAGRWLMGMIFLGACAFNTYTVINEPAAYMMYEQYAFLDWYQHFISGYFSRHILRIVLLIATGQFLVGLFLVVSEKLVRLGALGAIIFFLAIAPLGLGSGFPASLLLAFAAWLLYRKAPPGIL